jgi:SAM-dependent methyltransferase
MTTQDSAREDDGKVDGRSLDLSAIARNVEQVESGLWRVAGYEDLGFLSEDDTDWISIEADSFWYQHRVSVFLSFLTQYPPLGTLFEPGCGSAVNTVAFERAGYSVVGIEPTEHFAMVARDKGLSNVILGTLEACDFEPGELSNVCMLDVLEHIPDDAGYLRRIRELMPVDGRLYIAVPAWNWLWSNEDDDAGHLNRYSAAELRGKLEGAGFSIEFSSHYFLSLVAPIGLFRALPYRLGLRKKRNAKRSHDEHVLSDGILARALKAALAGERRWFSAGRSLSFGASVFVVARAT